MNIPVKFWNTAVAALGLLALFLLVISVKELKSISYVDPSSQTVNTITVTGTGDAVAIPDVATFSFTVTETAPTVADAQAKATSDINATLKNVRDGGVADKDIQTTSYEIDPHYEYRSGSCNTGAYNGSTSNGVMIPVPICPPGKQVLTGYDVSESVQVKVRDLPKAGALLSSIGTPGVQNVSGLSFSVDKPDAVQAEARAAAISDAKSKAQQLASQLGVSLVRITGFYESNDRVSPMVYGMSAGAKVMAPAAAPVAPEIPVGENKVTDDVTITYEIR